MWPLTLVGPSSSNCSPTRRMNSLGSSKFGSRGRSGGGSAAGIRLRAEQVQGNVLLVSEHPAVVPGRDGEEVAGPQPVLAAVGQPDGGRAAQDEAEVLDLTELGPGDRA